MTKETARRLYTAALGVTSSILVGIGTGNMYLGLAAMFGYCFVLMLWVVTYDE